jgi:four helix bundle protein
LAQVVYELTKRGPFSRDYALRDQIRRASISVMANIAEGFERNSVREFIQFLSIAKGSCGEVKAYLYVALDQQYIDRDAFDQVCGNIVAIGQMIGGLINYLRGVELRGAKYR